MADWSDPSRWVGLSLASLMGFMVITARLCFALLLILLPLCSATDGDSVSKSASLKPQLVIQVGHAHYVRALALSPDGQLLVSGGEDKAVLLWDVTTQRLVRRLGGHVREVRAVAFSPDGSLVASGADSAVVMGETYNSTVKIWDVETGQQVQVFEGEKARGLVGLAFAPRGIWVVWKEGVLKLRASLLEISTKRELRKLTLVGHTKAVAAAAFSADFRWLASAGFDNSIKIWDVKTGRDRLTLSGHKGTVWYVAFSSDGRWLASASGDNTVKLWDIETGREVRSFTGHGDAVRRLGFGSTGRTLASVDFGGTVILWDISTGQALRRIPQRRMGYGPLVFSPDDRWIATGIGWAIKGWEVATGRQVLELAGYVGWVDDIALGSDGKALVSAHYDKSVRMWDFTTGLLTRRLMGHDDLVSRVAISPDGRWVASVGYDQRIRLWETASGREQHNLPGHFVEQRLQHTGPIGFSPDSRLLATTGHRSLKLWDTSTGDEVRSASIQGPPPRRPVGFQPPNLTYINDLAFAPDGRWLALAVGGTGDKEVRVLEVSTGRDAGTLPGSGPVAFSPDSRFLTFGAGRRTVGREEEEISIQVWNVRSLRQKGMRKLAGTLRAGGAGAAFSPDLRYYSQGGGDYSVKVWNAATGHALHTLTGHTDWIKKMEFSADGRWLVTASLDGSIRIWDVSEGREVAVLIGMKERDDWVVVTPDGLFDGSPEGMEKLVAWRFGNEVQALELFFNEYYYPGLLAEILKGKAPQAPRDIAQLDRRQPQIEMSLAEPQSNGSELIDSRTVSVRVEVAEAKADAQRPQGSGAQDVRLFRNGSLVKIWRGDVLQGEPSISLGVEVPIVAGENRLTAYAFNRDSIKSADATLVITGDESLKRAGTAYILAIGINQYANADYNLRYAVPDARAFAEELQRQQTALGGFGQVEVIPLLNEEATKTNILHALARLGGKQTRPLPSGAPGVLEKLQRAEPEDAVFVYYAGHGTAAGDRFYLIPHDLGYQGKREELDERAVETILAHSISDEDLELAFETIDAGRLLLVIDACNSGQALEAEEKRRGPMNSKGLAQLAYEKGMYILTAAQGYQAALEVAQLGHGLLTYALVEEGLKTPSADTAPTDGEIVMREWLDYATLRVPQLQLDSMEEARKAGREIAMVDGEQIIREIQRRSLQRPRVFYRREPEAQPFVIAKSPPTPH